MREDELAEHHSSILRGCIALMTKMPSPEQRARQRDDFRAFADWCDFYGLSMPVEGEDVAQYLLELMADGASLAQLERVAASVSAFYQQRRCFLDPVPIEAALVLAEAQLSPNRTIN